MEKWKVADIRSHLEKTGDSPEKFAKNIQLSNMTIRRWLRKPDEFAIPSKYNPIFDVFFKPEENGSDPLAHPEKFLCESETPSAEEIAQIKENGGSFKSILSFLEKSGQSASDENQIYENVKTKLKGERIDSILHDHAQKLIKGITSLGTPAQLKTIGLGALLYLINPLDIIPDAIPAFGYLDDLAILALAIHYFDKKVA